MPAAFSSFRTSWPGIAVRRTASLPLAYARPSTSCFFASTIKTWMPGTSPGMTITTKRPRQNRGLRSRKSEKNRSARIEFDDQMRLHLHRERHVGQCRNAGEFRRHLGVIDFEKIRHVALGKLDRFQHWRELFGGFLDLDEVADLDLVAGNIDAAAVHLDVA